MVVLLHITVKLFKELIYALIAHIFRFLRVFYRNIDYTHMSWPSCDFSHVVSACYSTCILIICHKLSN